MLTKRLALKKPTFFESVPTKIGFEKPEGVLVCVRRAIRKNIMHALGHAGKTGQKTPKFSAFSKISCRKRK